MIWQWVIGIAVAIGIALAGGLWGAFKTLAQLVAKLVGEATEIKVDLKHLGPRVAATETKVDAMDSRVTTLEARAGP